jgi:hypothetical protein
MPVTDNSLQVVAIDRYIGVAEHEDLGLLGAIRHFDQLRDLAIAAVGLFADHQRDVRVLIALAQRDRNFGGGVLIVLDPKIKVDARIRYFQKADQVGRQRIAAAMQRLQHRHARRNLRQGRQGRSRAPREPDCGYRSRGVVEHRHAHRRRR